MDYPQAAGTLQMDQRLIERWTKEAQDAFNQKKSEPWFFNWPRWNNRIQLTRTIGEAEGLGESSICELQLALLQIAVAEAKALDPDTLKQAFSGSVHEILEVKRLKRILAVLQGEEPASSLEEQILHDSCWAFLGQGKFLRQGRLWRLELEHSGTEQFLFERNWFLFLVEQIKAHPFQTNFAQKEYGKKRLSNLSKVLRKAEKASTDQQRQKTGKHLGRGIDTLFRVGFNNHMEMSALADGKANMIISINTILLSILVTLGSTQTYWLERMDLRLLNFLPLGILLLTCTVSLVFALLSTRPKMTEDRVQSYDRNRLFFGVFLEQSKSEFLSYLDDLKDDQHRLYQHLGRDLYSLGEILNKKYRLIKYSYNCFLVGILVTVLSFVLDQFS